MRKSCGLADLLGQTYGDVRASPKSSAIAEEVVKRYQEFTSLALTEDPLSWWKAHERVYPFLAKMTKDTFVSQVGVGQIIDIIYCFL